MPQHIPLFLKVIVIACLLLIIITLGASVFGNYKFKGLALFMPLVAQNSGTAPYNVKLIIPKQWEGFVQDYCNELHGFAFAGRAFYVDWGDGSEYPDRQQPAETTKCGLEHTYENPGKYKIEAEIYDFSDIPPHHTTLWWNSEKITVE